MVRGSSIAGSGERVTQPVANLEIGTSWADAAKPKQPTNDATPAPTQPAGDGGAEFNFIANTVKTNMSGSRFFKDPIVCAPSLSLLVSPFSRTAGLSLPHLTG
jgi:hypothetical protein